MLRRADGGADLGREHVAIEVVAGVERGGGEAVALVRQIGDRRVVAVDDVGVRHEEIRARRGEHAGRRAVGVAGDDAVVAPVGDAVGVAGRVDELGGDDVVARVAVAEADARVGGEAEHVGDLAVAAVGLQDVDLPEAGDGEGAAAEAAGGELGVVRGVEADPGEVGVVLLPVQREAKDAVVVGERRVGALAEHADAAGAGRGVAQVAHAAADVPAVADVAIGERLEEQDVVILLHLVVVEVVRAEAPQVAEQRPVRADTDGVGAPEGEPLAGERHRREEGAVGIADVVPQALQADVDAASDAADRSRPRRSASRG